MHWTEEENFYLILRQFGPLTDQAAEQIKERLETLFFVEFTLALKGMEYTQTKGSRGKLWLGVEQNPELSALRKEIDNHLKDLPLHPEERSFNPQIILGRYDRLNGQKLGEYLFSYGAFQSEPFEISCCQLLTSHQTPKHFYYQVVQQFNASAQTTGED